MFSPLADALFVVSLALFIVGSFFRTQHNNAQHRLTAVVANVQVVKKKANTMAVRVGNQRTLARSLAGQIKNAKDEQRRKQDRLKDIDKNLANTMDSLLALKGSHLSLKQKLGFCAGLKDLGLKLTERINPSGVADQAELYQNGKLVGFCFNSVRSCRRYNVRGCRPIPSPRRCPAK